MAGPVAKGGVEGELEDSGRLSQGFSLFLPADQLKERSEFFSASVLFSQEGGNLPIVCLV